MLTAGRTTEELRPSARRDSRSSHLRGRTRLVGSTSGNVRSTMIVIVGIAIVFGAVIAGFTWSGGHVGALIHPAELVTIGGASLGALIMMSPKKVLIDLGRALG